MVKGKSIRKKGKVNLSRYFKKINVGSQVSIVSDVGCKITFPRRLKGKTGKISGERGKFKLVELRDGNKKKTFIIHPIHLRKV